MGYGTQTQRWGVMRQMSVKPKSAEVVDLIEKLDREDLERLVHSLLSNGVARRRTAALSSSSKALRRMAISMLVR